MHGVYQSRPSHRSVTHFKLARRYLQQLIDIEVEAAKAKGKYETGVLFLDRGVRHVEAQVVWRHPHGPQQGEVRCLCLKQDMNSSKQQSCGSSANHR